VRAARRSGCLIAFMVVVGLAGLWLVAFIGSSLPIGVLGIILLGAAVLFFFNLAVLQPSLANRAMEAGRRREQAWYESRPQLAIARSDDPLVAARDLTWSQRGGAFLGISPDYREWMTAEAEQAVLVLGPPRSGKTASIIIPSILNAAGPVVSTATRRDVMAATYRARSRYGRVWLYDPMGEDDLPEGVLRLQWSPIWSSRTWDGARAMADAMVNASAIATTSSGSGSENAYWTEAAKALLGPMLHAAALSGRSIADARRWILHADYKTPREVLVSRGALLAADDLQRIAQTDDRERGSVVNTSATVLRAYGSQTVLDHSATPNFDVERFVQSADTVYIAAPATQQEMLAPLVVGVLEEIRNAVYRQARRADPSQPRRPSMLWALDEIANIAPLRTLPAIVSEGGGQGLQLMACFQDLTQASVRWPKAADGFLTLFGTKVVFPGIGDRKTLEALSMMVGDWDRPYVVTGRSYGRSVGVGLIPEVTITRGATASFSTQREARLSPGEIANIPPGTALIVRSGRYGLVEPTPYFNALPWTAVIAQAPAAAVSRGGPDVLVPAPGSGDRTGTDQVAATPEDADV
jgi:type IV secretory pathway TraG/TraD family ATPase VirD4